MRVKILIALKSFESKQLYKSSYNDNPKIQLKEPPVGRRSLKGRPEVHPFGGEPAPFLFLRSTLFSTETRRTPPFGWTSGDQRKARQHLVSVPLPKTQFNYTILRSPHIDKKSRDQFELKIHKQLIIISTEIRRIREKLFNLKFHEMPGIQMKVVFQTKTRLVGP